MSAHPMLQPVDWTLTPEKLLGGVSPQRHAIYKVIWDSAIACTLRAPLLEHQRFVLQSGPTPLVLTSRKANPIRVGFWHARTDEPRSAFPVNVGVDGNAFMVTQAWSVPASRLSLGSLIGAMERFKIGTPSSVSATLKSMITANTQPRLHMIKNAEHETGPRWRVELTVQGRDDLLKWRQAGVIPNIQSLQRTLLDVERGDLSVHNALDTLAPELGEELRERISQDIGIQCKRWQGMSRDEGHWAIERAALKIPKVRGLPIALDPEKILPSNSSVRAQRQMMEESLAKAHPNWRSFSEAQRISNRIDWLRSCHLSGNAQKLPNPDASSAQFDALLAWFVGGFSSVHMEH